MTTEAAMRALVWKNVVFGIVMLALSILILEVKSKTLFLAIVALAFVWAISLFLDARKPKGPKA